MTKTELEQVPYVMITHRKSMDLPFQNIHMQSLINDGVVTFFGIIINVYLSEWYMYYLENVLFMDFNYCIMFGDLSSYYSYYSFCLFQGNT